jgi:hypothetical protein
MKKRNRYIIKDEERGHRPKLNPDEPTIRVTLQFPESQWKAIKEKSQGKHQQWIREVLAGAVCLLFVFTLAHGEDFMDPITNGSDSCYRDTNFYINNAVYLTASYLHNKGVGNIQKLVRVQGSIKFVVGSDTLTKREFVKRMIEDSATSAIYKTEAIDLIRTHHTMLLIPLCIRNDCKDIKSYIVRSGSIARKLGVLLELEKIKEELVTTMKNYCEEAIQHPQETIELKNVKF